MGCFLTITSRDFAQLSATLKRGVSVVGSAGANAIKIQVHPTALNSAREMAKQIRRQAKSAKVATGSSLDSSRASSTKERMKAQVATLSLIVGPNVASEYLQNRHGTEMRRFGKAEAEPIAAKILEQSSYLDGTKGVKVTRSTGVDIAGRSRTGANVVVEVKFSTQDKDFGKMMSDGAYESKDYPKGRRQMSDSWLKKVSADIKLEKTNILGVHINPARGTITIYRRMDSEAKNWKPLMTKPLSEYNL